MELEESCIEVDFDLFKTMILNLVDNAVKYADEGGEMRPKSGNRRQILHKFNRKIIRIEHRVR